METSQAFGERQSSNVPFLLLRNIFKGEVWGPRLPPVSQWAYPGMV